MRDHDVFLSLHRSEGFGLGCAEALAVGNIVVSTDYGGTRDFISEETGFPVDWKRVDVGEGEYVEAEEATWAEPSIDHAAHRLREVYDAPRLARNRALVGHQKNAGVTIPSRWSAVGCVKFWKPTAWLSRFRTTGNADCSATCQRFRPIASRPSKRGEIQSLSTIACAQRCGRLPQKSQSRKRSERTLGAEH